MGIACWCGPGGLGDSSNVPREEDKEIDVKVGERADTPPMATGRRVACLLSGSGSSRKGSLLAAAVLAAAAMTLLLAPLASAATVTDRPLLFKFQTGQRTTWKIASDNASGAIYATENAERPGGATLAKFHPDGTPWDFSATGSNKIAFAFGGISSRENKVAVDNSGGATQGRFYVNLGGLQRRISGFAPSGELLWTYRPTDGVGDVAVDTSGNLWTVPENGGEVKVYDVSGNVPALVNSFPISNTYYADLDSSGNLYQLFTELTKWENETPTWSKLGDANGDVSVDQESPSGHIFQIFGDRFVELEQDGTEVGTYGEQFLSGNETGFVTEGRGVTYLPSLDRVYVYVGRWNPGDAGRAEPTILVFGPPRTGTVPDLTVGGPTEVGVSSAKFTGSINPQGTESEWYFEWKKKGSDWDTAESSPAQSLPSDSASHSVEFTSDSLRGNTEYDVRLVAVNVSNDLRNFSDSESFTTGAATTPPVVTIDSASGVGTDSATISGTVNPEGDTADWRVQLSTDPTCSEGFENETFQQISMGANSPQSVAYELVELLPSQHYCARIEATNSAGSTTSSVVEFTTDPVAATGLESIGVAPRLDTSARLNALVNPQGEDLHYQFEYSSDGGSNWVALAEEVDQSQARQPIVISSEVSGLQPGTAYDFRVAIENSVGAGTSGTGLFTTRTTAEVTLPAIGYELVNNPDKGNQNVDPIQRSAFKPLSADGDKAIWDVTGGAPGGFNGNGAIFLAERTASGWQSRSLLPPPSQQPGDGAYLFELGYHTPDMSQFVLKAGQPNLSGLGQASETSIVRLDAHQHLEVLDSFEKDLLANRLFASTDTSHVILAGAPLDTRGQIFDVGSGNREVLSIMPDGTESECEVVYGSNSKGGTSFGVEQHPGYFPTATTDGSIVYFKTQENGNCSGPEQLYVRNRQTNTTTLIDPADEGGEPVFIRATPDGGEGYFLTDSKLDPADQNTGRDLYRWSVTSGSATCLTCVVPDARVTTVAISDDFSRVYFGSKEALVPGKGTQLGGGEKVNIYTLSGSELKYVATTLGNGIRELSPDGSKMLFAAPASLSLTSDKTAEICPKSLAEASGTSDCVQLYRYEVAEDSLECLSCVRGGVTNWASGNSEGDLEMSSDGRVVAFRTNQSLLPRDINRRLDLYEWRNGALRLLTDGTSNFPDQGFARPMLRAITADGSTILYSAPEPGLTGYERDEVSNMYVARVGGGFPRPPAVQHCSEESCQGPLQTPPSGQSAGSEGVQGRGNVRHKVRKCRKGAVRRQGRCVRKRHSRGHRHHRQGAAKRGGAK